MTSADGKGRTIWDILWGRNKKRPTPLELEYFNPLGAKIGTVITFQHEPELEGIDFPVEKISVAETVIRGKKFFHTDYWLKGVASHLKRPLRFKLRLLPDENSVNDLGCKVQLLFLCDELEWSQEFYNYCCRPIYIDPTTNETDLCFCVKEDDDGNPLEIPRLYWRVGETAKDPVNDPVLDPYHAHVSLLADVNKDGKVDSSEVEKSAMTYWDYARDTQNEAEQEITEYLTVEMDNPSRYFMIYRGTDVDPSQILVL